MNTEYEARKLGVSFTEIIKKMKEIGAKPLGAYRLRRYVYDLVPARRGEWIRLRSNGEVSTLAIKEVRSHGIDGTKEWEVEVSDFDGTNELLKKLGYEPKSYQENYRVEYVMDGVKFDLDKWPMIPPHLEVEGKSERSLLRAIKQLGWEIGQMTTLDIGTIYSKIYGIDLREFKDLKLNEEEIRFIRQYFDVL